tara:strand:- start:49 stop:255 length:207 start_codon:yes stop_codon:yes gene_type:complete
LGDDAVAAAYTAFDIVDLNVEQRFVYELLVRHAKSTLDALADATPPPPPLFMVINGCGGTGKSFLLHC